MLLQDLLKKTDINYSRLLDGKRVFVSTASQGIGFSIALLFAKHGATVAAGGRNAPKLKAAIKEIRLHSPDSRSYICDLGNKTALEAVCDQILADFGGVDILVNSVGINQQCSIHNATDEIIDTMINTNYKSGLYCARKFLPGMITRGVGNIINISSTHSIQTSGSSGIYAGTKAAVEATTRAMAIDYAKNGIRVNSILPGLILSDLILDGVYEHSEGEERDKYIEKLLSIQPMPPGQVEDVANASLFLASDMSAYMTGNTLIVDGGAYIKNKW